MIRYVFDPFRGVYSEASSNTSTGTGAGKVTASPSEPYYAVEGGSTYTAADKVSSESNNRFEVYRKTEDGAQITLRVYRPGGGNDELALQYASFGYEAFSRSAGNQVEGRWFTYGFETDAASVPRTGSAQYAGVLYGTGTSVGTDQLYSVTGSASFNFDFSAATFTGSMSPVLTSQSGTRFNVGSLTFTDGKVTSGANSFSAAFGGDATRSPGSLRGRFFGPSANEVAAIYSVLLKSSVVNGDPSFGIGISGAIAAARK